MTLLLCFVSLTMVAQVSQSTTTITAGNRIAMGVPVQQVRIQELNLLQHNDLCVK